MRLKIDLNTTVQVIALNDINMLVKGVTNANFDTVLPIRKL